MSNTKGFALVQLENSWLVSRFITENVSNSLFEKHVVLPYCEAYPTTASTQRKPASRLSLDLLGSITSRCSGNEPALLPELLGVSWGYEEQELLVPIIWRTFLGFVCRQSAAKLVTYML